MTVLQQTLTAWPTPAAIERPRGAEISIASPLDRGSERISERIDFVLKAIKEQNLSPVGTHPLSAAWQSLDELYDIGENWNGHDVSAPNPDAIEKAKKWLLEIYKEMKANNAPWHSPHVTANEDGSLVLEWVRHRRRASCFISPGETWYIKAWGSSIENEMSDGVANRPCDFTEVYDWLME